MANFSPCNQTAHFTDLTQQAPPAPNATGCPAYVVTDFANITGSGQGIEHLTEWFGGSFNKNNFVNHDTINFAGDQGVSFHAVDHLSQSAAGQVRQFDIASC